MRQFVRDALREPSQSIRLVALDIIKDLPSRNYRAEMTALHAFVRDQIRYVRDPEGIESVATPEKTLQLGQGDCDDKSTLLAALLMSVGHPVRFVAVGMGGGPLSHVLVESRLADKWVPLETIIPKPPGWYPSGVTKRFVLHI
jgi:transglutaminase-like putative cysteine protease